MSSAQRIRAWNGPQILGYGFRPFFLGAALFAALAMVVWIGALSGLWSIPSAFGPVEWHVHEFLWGYLSAVVAGFMLTAVPNWTGRLPIAFDGDDKVIIACTALALLLWIFIPESIATALAMLAASVGNLWRLSRWAGWRSLAEPLVGILHLAYLFLPLGFFAMAAAMLLPEWVPHSAGLHTWTVGAIVLMPLAVMTRASLGHSGMPLTADWRISAIYLLAAVAALARVGAGLFPQAGWLLDTAGASWVLAFLAFAVVYAPLFMKRRAAA